VEEAARVDEEEGEVEEERDKARCCVVGSR
jgi:hypothetical protein